MAFPFGAFPFGPLSLALALSSLPLGSALAAASPEQETLRLSRLLRPIPDQEWEVIAGARASQTYRIAKDDTLYGISQRLFGDPDYWPKIWALNNRGITNPHRIFPGRDVLFMPGTGGSLPAIALEGSSKSAPALASGLPSRSAGGPSPAAAPSDSRARSQEWRKLPLQRWETVLTSLSPEIDPQGFDRRSRVPAWKNPGFDLNLFAATRKTDVLGDIGSGRSPANYFGIGDVVYIQARGDRELQVGETYSVTEAPTLLRNRNSDRTGFSYHVLGEVRIIGVKDQLFVGLVENNRGLIPRGAALIPMLPRMTTVSPIPGPTNLEATVFFDREISTFSAAQQKQVFIDRGSEDGVQPGMVFRAYQHTDPVTEEKITDSHFIVDATMMVLQASERFSTGIILESVSTVQDGASLVLLTDVSSLLAKSGSRMRHDHELGETNELDELEKIDRSGDLGKGEAKELDQLERWEEGKGEKVQAAPSTEPAEEAVPTAPDTSATPAASAQPDELDSDLDALEKGADSSSAEAPTETPTDAAQADSAPSELDDLSELEDAAPPAAGEQPAEPEVQAKAPEVSPPDPPSAADALDELSRGEVPPAAPEAVPDEAPAQDTAKSGGSEEDELDKMLQNDL